MSTAATPLRKFLTDDLSAPLDAPAELTGKARELWDLRARFLLDLSDHGMVGRAADSIKRRRITLYAWKIDDPEFAAAWEEAHSVAMQTLEEEALRRGREGVEKPVYQGGQMVGTVREYSDPLLARLLQAHHPKFRDRVEVELPGVENDKALATEIAKIAGVLVKRKAEDEV